MAYLRVKSIRGQKYLYLVKSAWDAQKKTSKQTIIKYLGIESEVTLDDLPDEYRDSRKINDYFLNRKYFQPKVQNELIQKLQLDLLSSFKNGDFITAHSMIGSYEKIYGFDSFLDEVLIPLIAEIGNLGNSKKINLGTQATCYNTIEDLLTKIIENNSINPSKKKVLICVPNGEQHTLGTKILQTKLSMTGNIVYNLPPFTPTSLIMESIEHDGPDCVFISVTLDENVLSAKRMVEKINEKYGLPIIIGGNAIKNDSENWDLTVGKNLSIPKILKLIQSKKLQIITTN